MNALMQGNFKISLDIFTYSCISISSCYILQCRKKISLFVFRSTSLSLFLDIMVI